MAAITSASLQQGRRERHRMLGSTTTMQVAWVRIGGQCLETETLVDFLAGRVDPAVRARVERHASRCASCRKIMSALAGGGTPATASRSSLPHLAGRPPGTRVGRYLIERAIG